MKNLTAILIFFLFLLPMTGYAQFCCCVGCGNTCISQAGEANCGAACFFSCGNPTPFETSTDGTCFGTACNPPLPIELAEFLLNGREDGIILQWSTASESNNEGFEIQRISGVNMSWINLGFVHGAGTTNTAQHYSFMDKTAPPGVNYYRIKQVDYDNTERFTQVESARVDANDKYTMWPTLTRDQVMIRINDDHHNHTQTHQAYVFDMVGRLVHEETFVEGLALDVSNYPPGNFVVNVSSHGKVQTFRFVKVE